MAGVWTGAGLKALALPRENPEAALENLAGALRPAPGALRGALPLTPAAPAGAATVPQALHLLVDEVEKYFEGEKVAFTAPLDWSGYTPFQRRVLELVRTIPHGEVHTYGRVAREAGSPLGARAVGGVMWANRTPLVIPCHRVVAANGSVGGFSGPPGMKKYLLELEKTACLRGLPLLR